MYEQITAPTSEQCNNNEKVFDDGFLKGFAIWYPQMGSYSSLAVVIFGDSRCFDALIWHDGEFPFDGEGDKQPRLIHHCSAEQFIDFGATVIDMQRKLNRINHLKDAQWTKEEIEKIKSYDPSPETLNFNLIAKSPE